MKVGMLFMCAISMMHIQADNQSWFAGWGTALKNASAGLWNSVASSSFFNKNKEKVIATTAVTAGAAGLAGWTAYKSWWNWFRKPVVQQELKQAIKDFYNSQVAEEQIWDEARASGKASEQNAAARAAALAQQNYRINNVMPRMYKAQKALGYEYPTIVPREAYYLQGDTLEYRK